MFSSPNNTYETSNELTTPTKGSNIFINNYNSEVLISIKESAKKTIKSDLKRNIRYPKYNLTCISAIDGTNMSKFPKFVQVK